MIDVSDINFAILVQRLHANTRPVGLGFMHDNGDISLDFAKDLIERSEWADGSVFFDYVQGRPIKCNFIKKGDKRFLVRSELYDRDAGQGACETAIAEARELSSA